MEAGKSDIPFEEQLRSKSDTLAMVLLSMFDTTPVTKYTYEEWKSIQTEKTKLLSDLFFAFAETIQATQSGVIILDDEVA